MLGGITAATIAMLTTSTKTLTTLTFIGVNCSTCLAQRFCRKAREDVWFARWLPEVMTLSRDATFQALLRQELDSLAAYPAAWRKQISYDGYMITPLGLPYDAGNNVYAVCMRFLNLAWVAPKLSK